jgi:hypothetical protein
VWHLKPAGPCTLGFAASHGRHKHGRCRLAGRPSISHRTAASQETSTITYVHLAITCISLLTPLPPPPLLHLHTAPAITRVITYVDTLTKPSARDPLSTSILYLNLADCALHKQTPPPTTRQQQSLPLPYCPPPNAAGPAACPSSPTPHCSGRLLQTPLWGSAPGNLIIQRIHLDCRLSIHAAPLPRYHPQ